MWSFVANKNNKQWIWLALNMATREIVRVYVGERSREGAQGLWDSLPAVYRQCAVSYTDFWSAYDEVFPSKRHQSVRDYESSILFKNRILIDLARISP